MTRQDQATIEEIIAFATGKYPPGREIPPSWQSILPLLRDAPRLQSENSRLREALIQSNGRSIDETISEALDDAMAEIEHCHRDQLTDKARQYPRSSGWAAVHDKLHTARDILNDHAA